MSFVEAGFLGFLALVVPAYWALPLRLQNVLLAVASAVFYGWVHPWLVLVLAGSAMFNFGAGLALERARSRRGAVLLVSVLANLAVLAAFKYGDFFVAPMARALHTDPAGLRVVLPVGLSFYTLANLGYLVDVYRGRVAARADPVLYFLFVGFFPQLVAGPIARAQHLLPQLERPRAFALASVAEGLGLAVLGAFKKIVVADNLGAYVDAVHAESSPSAAMVWAAALGFAVQILMDFSGYSDLARGVARMLGLDLQRNFRWPFLATSPSDLWERWHISLSTWLRDYVFQPLATSAFARRYLVVPGVRMTPTLHVYRAIVGTAIVSGLWHGASWRFLLWGLYWAAVSLVYDGVQRRLPARWVHHPRGGWVAVPLMWLVLLVAAQLFRVPSAERLWTYLWLPPLAGTGAEWTKALLLLATTAALASPVLLAAAWEGLVLPRAAPRGWTLPVTTTALTLLAWTAWVFYRPTGADFIYFAF